MEAKPAWWISSAWPPGADLLADEESQAYRLYKYTCYYCGL